jgi:hypothetical protein
MVLRTEYGDGPEVECWMADGLDEAFLGHGDQAGQTVAVYDYEKCVEIFMARDGATRDEADEHMSYNVAGTYLPGRTPVFLHVPEATLTKFATQQHKKRPAGWA